ncbi:MAG TPA: pyridoxamine 5'-phosphate oxidase family protein [Candidatus Limnocylindrales bacterium]|nr:pyridoxamine 5'-phosphate oxidase family protein [Candidatus Limnocylindrales bacterium]
MSTSTITESPNPTTYPATPRTTLKRLAVRGRYDRAAVHAVLDEALVCHVAFVADGSPVVIPVAYARIGDDLYLHGSTANRMLRTLAGGGPASIAVTLLDGLVLARSAFHHSVNYRSVVVFGTGERVTDPDEHARALAAVVEHVVPGRSAYVRGPNREESLRTLVVRFPIIEVSMKERMGGPVDDEEDYDLGIWAGTIPLTTVFGAPVDDPLHAPRAEPPEHARSYRRPSVNGAVPE